MCGIAGFTCPASVSPVVMDAMLVRIAHRGPDGTGVHQDNDIAMGNVLLAIVDIGHGQQPMRMSWLGETYVCVFNGEIYNHRELRTELESQGIVLQTHCDTEVALAACACWGKDALSKFEGQWAIAVWCQDRRELLLARDPLGIKPLFLYEKGSFLAFASEPKALFAHPDIPCRPNIAAIQDYFLHGFAFAAGYSLNYRSFYEGVTSLPPGSFLKWSMHGKSQVSSYYLYPLAEPMSSAEAGDVPELLNHAVSSSVKACLMGDAPIGVALSGGLDSSIITAVAAQVRQINGEPPLLASCIRYRGQAENDDAYHAHLLAEYLGSHAPVRLVYSEMDASRYLEDVDRMVYHFDEPHWEVKQLAMFNNYRKLKEEGAKVVLTGEGADELFFGYFHRFPGFRHPVIESAGAFRHLWSARLPAVGRMLGGSLRNSLESRLEEALDQFYAPYAPPANDPARAMQCWYLSTFLHWLLIDNDRCSMAFSLEGRFPFLNRRVFELALRIPSAWQLGGDHGEEKLQLRKAFRMQLPEEIWRKRKKAPLPSPLLLDFHRCLRDATIRALNESPRELWDVLDRRGAEQMVSDYSHKIEALRVDGQTARGGESLTSYLHMDEPWSVRTPHVFGLLTLIRWWAINFK